MTANKRMKSIEIIQKKGIDYEREKSSKQLAYVGN